MKTKLLILVALGLLILPVGSFIVIFAPFYVSMWMALYFLYDPKQPGAANPFENALWDFSVVWEQYGRVFSHWMNTPDPDWSSYTLPLFGPSAGGLMVSGLMGWSAYRYLRGFFDVDKL
jgi:hypothetical protein